MTTTDTATGLDSILSLAAQIGKRVQDGRLPQQNDHGRYVFTSSDFNFAFQEES